MQHPMQHAENISDYCRRYHGPGMCIPIYWNPKKSPLEHQRIEKALGGFHPYEWAQLKMLLGSGQDINHLIRVIQVIDRYNAFSAREVGQQPQTTPYSIIASTGALPGFAGTFDATRARITSLAEEFTKRMNMLNEKQLLFYNAVGKDAKTAARSAYQDAYRAAMDVVNRQTKLAFIGEETRNYLRTGNHALKAAKRKGIWVHDLKDVQTLKRIAVYGKWLGWGIYGVTVAKDYRDVMITRKEGGNWQKEAAEDIGEITGQLAFAFAAERSFRIVAIFLPGGGWLFLGVSIGVELLMMKYGSQVGKWFGSELEQHFARI